MVFLWEINRLGQPGTGSLLGLDVRLAADTALAKSLAESVVCVPCKLRNLSLGERPDEARICPQICRISTATFVYRWRAARRLRTAKRRPAVAKGPGYYTRGGQAGQ